MPNPYKSILSSLNRRKNDEFSKPRGASYLWHIIPTGACSLLLWLIKKKQIFYIISYQCLILFTNSQDYRKNKGFIRNFRITRYLFTSTNIQKYMSHIKKHPEYNKIKTRRIKLRKDDYEHGVDRSRKNIDLKTKVVYKTQKQKNDLGRQYSNPNE